MSNKIVPSVYRLIIDDVIGNMKAEFDEYGVSEDVLGLLQDKWEAKVIESGVAEFEPNAAQPPQPPPSVQSQNQNFQNPPQQQQQQQVQQPPPQQQYTLPPPPPHYVKTEPIERPFLSNLPPPGPGPNMQQYMLPPINGQSNGRAGQSVLVLPRAAPPMQNGNARYAGGGASGGRIPQLDGPSYHIASIPSASTSTFTSVPTRTAPSSIPIPQLDGPSSSGTSSDADSPDPKQTSSTANAVKNEGGGGGGTGEEINSDLDDSDSDADDDEDPAAAVGADVDIVFCTYDKVQRVKNKWKCVLKDGMIHVNGKDYLFAKCNGEFEW